MQIGFRIRLDLPRGQFPSLRPAALLVDLFEGKAREVVKIFAGLLFDGRLRNGILL